MKGKGQWNTALLGMGNSLHFSTVTHKVIQPETKAISHGYRKEVPGHSDSEKDLGHR